MPQRLSVADASLLTLDAATTPMHAGGISLFEPGLAFADVLETLRSRLDAVPLARQRLQPVALRANRPVWVDDAHFDLSYHLRHAALPAPGESAQLGEFVSRLIGRPLDRSRPLWEIYVIEGLEGGRTALFRKVHLAMAGGDHGDPFAVLLDDVPDSPVSALGDLTERWEPEAPPGMLNLAAEGARDRARNLGQVAQTAARAMGRPSQALELAISTFGVLGRVLRGRPDSPLNVRLSPHRRFATARVELEDLRAVRRAFGGTINDAVVAVVGDAVGRLLRWRGHETKDLDLQVMVPVRVHQEHGAAEEADEALPVARSVGEGVVGVLAPLPVMEMDPVARLYRVMGELAGLKESRQAVAADTLVRLSGYAPANLHATAARLASAEQRYNVALSNAPGPQQPRYLAGVRMREAYPFIPLAGDAALSISVSSYDGVMFFGLLGDRDAMRDLDVLAEFVPEAVRELREAVPA
jgi:diacylglycerol O-acyltransferase / wax synthase